MDKDPEVLKRQQNTSPHGTPWLNSEKRSKNRKISKTPSVVVSPSIQATATGDPSFVVCVVEWGLKGVP
jgi:hypothetical protein